MIVDPTDSELRTRLATKVDDGDWFAQVALNGRPAAVASIAQDAAEYGWRVVSVWHQNTVEYIYTIDCTHILFRYEAP